MNPWDGCATTNMRHGVGSRTTVRLANVALPYTTVMQSFGIDSTRREIYTCQVIQGGVQLADETRTYTHAERAARGDLVFARHDSTGAVVSRMWARGFGHGQGMGVEVDSNGVVWIWTGSEGSQAAAGENSRPFALSRIQYTPNLILDPGDRPVMYPDGVPRQSTYPSVDPTTGTLCAKWWNGTQHTARLYDLAEAASGIFTPLAEITYTEGTVAQGYQTFGGTGGFYYVLYGTTEGNENGTGARIAVYSWRTGRHLATYPIQGAKTLDYREPEGLAIYQPDPEGRPEYGEVWHGFATGPAGDRRAVFSQFGAVCTGAGGSPMPPPPAGRTWGELLALNLTWAEVQASLPLWSDVIRPPESRST